MSTEENIPVDGAGKIDPSQFPVPKTMTHVLEMRAAKLRTGGQNMQETGDDIVSAWDGLTEAYKAPEAETLYAALDPLTSNGAVIGMATNRVAGALEEFAETVREIQGSWRELKSEAEAFRAQIADEGEDWDKGEGFLGWGDSSNVDKNDAFLLRASNLVEDFKEAEVACANKINIGIDGRTDFLSEDDLDGAMPEAHQFVHGVGVDLEEIPTSWGEAAASTDHGWVRDVGDAIWDFGVGAVEGTGAMLGAHSSEGWFAQSWGDSLKEYHWDNLTSAASLVGMYDAESDSLGWAGGETAKEAWKDLAHSVVPWEEWGDRPGYVIGTGLLNIGSMVGGAVLTATGVGAVVGVPLMAWRGMAILDGMGGSGRGPDVDLLDLPDVPTYGGSGAPVVNIDTSNFTPAQAAELTASLDRLNTTVNGSGSGNGSNSNETATGGGRPNQPAPSSSEAEPNKPTKPTAVQEDPAPETTRSEDGAEDENSTDRSDNDDAAETTASQQRQDEAAETTTAGSEGLHQEPTTLQALESDRALRGVISDEHWAEAQAYDRATTSEFEGDRAQQDSSRPVSKEQVDEQYQHNPEYKHLGATLDETASRYPGFWLGSAGDGVDMGPNQADRPLTPAGNVPDSNSNHAQNPGGSEGRHLNLGDSSGDRSSADRAGERDARTGSEARREGADDRTGDHNAEVGGRGPTAAHQEGNGPTRNEPSQGTGARGDGTPEPNRTDPDSSSTRRDGDDSSRDSTPANPGLGTDGPDSTAPRRGGDDSPSRAPSERNGPGGRGEDPVSVPKTREEAQAKAYDILRTMDLGKGPEFVKKFVALVNDNKYGDLLEKAFYNSIGHRHSADLEVNNQPIPSLVRADPNDPWVARDSLPPPLPPKYLAGEIRGSRVGVVGATLQKLDKFANLRKISLDAYNPLNKVVKTLKAEHKANPGQATSQALEAARENRRPMGGMKKRFTEMFGERAGERAVRDNFTGSEVSFEEPFRDSNGKTVKDAQGNDVTTTWKGTLPELAESTPDKPNPIPVSENAPKNGNDQFDQIWRTKDGGFVVVEAKSSLDTELGERTIKAGEGLKRVSQGTREYFNDILERMAERGGQEEILANQIKMELASPESKVHYVEARGNPSGYKYSGNSMRFFDIRQ